VSKVAKDMRINIKRTYIRIFVLICVLIFIFAFTQAQQEKRPQAFRSTALTSIPLVLPSTLDLQLLEAFVLMQKANAGESPAQHELGLRYLLGKGFQVDTEKAAIWIKKAADQQLPLAQYNMGILLTNGYGVDWNPFEAFNYFMASAEQDLPEALYVIGLQYTEKFVVPRNYPKAYRYFNRSAELGFEAANIAKKEMVRRGLNKYDTTDVLSTGKERGNKNHSSSTKKDTSYNLLFIDFQTDTVSAIADTTLIHEAYQAVENYSNDSFSENSQNGRIDTTNYSALLQLAEAGCPEALCFLGRCHERGLKVKKDVILAGVYYLRALHLDAYRAPALLWKLTASQNFENELIQQTSKNNPDALYVWSGLTSIGFSRMLDDKKAFDLLEHAAVIEHVPSMVEIGLCYFTGRWIQQDREKAVEWWSRASKLGSIDAEIRIAIANVLGQIHTEGLDISITRLRTMAKKGSLLSSLTLAYCYEKGVGMQQNKGEAYRLYHKALMRGSEAAFRSLQNMHDQLRPADSKFQLSD
jgi:uncharacterized protein